MEDDLLYRESFRIALTESRQFDFIAEATTVREAVRLAEQMRFDLAVVDFMVPDGDAISLARELRRRRVRLRMLILAGLSLPVFADDALALGIAGYALKDEPLVQVITAILTVAAGGTYLSPRVERVLPDAGKTSGLESLSNREREILLGLRNGLSAKEIARALFISPRTVDSHRLQIHRKLGTRSPTQLARFVADHGLLSGRRKPTGGSV
jgi:DNA-binding NarL/FixJ family response regulator